MHACQLTTRSQQLRVILILTAYFLGPTLSWNWSVGSHVQWSGQAHGIAFNKTTPVADLTLLNRLFGGQSSDVVFIEKTEPYWSGQQTPTTIELEMQKWNPLEMHKRMLNSDGHRLVLQGKYKWVSSCPGISMVAFLLGFGLAIICVHCKHDSADTVGTAMKVGCCVIALICSSYPFALAPTLIQANPLFKLMQDATDFLTIGKSHDWFWYTWGASALVCVVLFSSTCQRVLSQPPFIWLGKISFGLYLTHIPIMYSLSCYVFVRILDMLHGIEADTAGSSLEYDLAFVATTLVSIPLMFGAAAIFHKFVDQPAIAASPRIASWLLGVEYN